MKKKMLFGFRYFLTRSGYTVNTDYVKISIFRDFDVNFPIFPDFHALHFPILCK